MRGKTTGDFARDELHPRLINNYKIKIRKFFEKPFALVREKRGGGVCCFFFLTFSDLKEIF